MGIESETSHKGESLHMGSYLFDIRSSIFKILYKYKYHILTQKALNAIYVNTTSFRLISSCVDARNAWLILQKQCESSTSVKMTNMRILTTKFENLRMREDETISSFHGKIGEISNEVQALDDPISNERLVSKFVRSLPERYNIKISSREEVKDVSTLELSQLVSVLTTF